MRYILKHPLDMLLLFVPLTIVIDLLSPKSHILIFIFACLAILPLAGWLGKGTEHLADRTSEGLSGLINATFGNAAELIIGFIALRKGMIDIVKASLTGSIIGNILLVMGVAYLAGGMRHKTQRFNASAARSQATMLTLAAIALILPAMFHHLGGDKVLSKEIDLSFDIAVVLIVTYAFSLIFSLHTHKQLFQGKSIEAVDRGGESHEPWSVGRAFAVLVVSAALIGFISEILVGSVEEAAHSLGMTNIFIGIIVVAIIGNAAEHSTAVLAAVKNRMDMSMTISVGSSIQIALFVAPVLLFASYFTGPKPMNLVFTVPEVIAIGLSVIIVEQISGDGESNWLEGVQLLSVYVILGIVFYFLP